MFPLFLLGMAAAIGYVVSQRKTAPEGPRDNNLRTPQYGPNATNIPGLGNVFFTANVPTPPVALTDYKHPITGFPIIKDANGVCFSTADNLRLFKCATPVEPFPVYPAGLVNQIDNGSGHPRSVIQDAKMECYIVDFIGDSSVESYTKIGCGNLPST